MELQGGSTPEGFVADLGRWVNRAARDLARAGDAALAPLGLRYSQIPVLAMLQNGNALTQTELATTAGIEQPSMAQLLARMRRDELIETAPHPRDGRSQVVSLTPTARAVLDDAHTRITEMEQQALQGFTGRDSTMLINLLIRLSRNLHETQFESPTKY